MWPFGDEKSAPGELRAEQLQQPRRGLFHKLSPGARDFVNTLLALEPLARPNMDGVLAHPWLAEPPADRLVPYVATQEHRVSAVA